MFSQKTDSLKADEKLVYTLRALYESFGYSHYRMSKFEEYDLYVRNKDFLSASGIITFTDTNGRLMALKPDVTLSIIKNASEQGVQKVFYNENVYRVSKNSGRYSEIMQTGLECVGDIGEYEITEALLLAVKSLEATGCDFSLDIANMGVLSELISRLPLSEKETSELLTSIKRKNANGIAMICEKCGADKADSDALTRLVGLYGKAEDKLSELKAIGISKKYTDQLERLMAAISACGYGNKINIDFSVLTDMGYYNGIVFRGYISGVPEYVLAGGAYDLLMKKMGRSCGGVGFAVCLDSLDRLNDEKKKFDCDIMLVYGDTDTSKVLKTVSELSDNSSVHAVKKSVPEIRAAKTLILNSDGTVSEVENNA